MFLTDEILKMKHFFCKHFVIEETNYQPQSSDITTDNLTSSIPLQEFGKFSIKKIKVETFLEVMQLAIKALFALKPFKWLVSALD